jgi:hypothetical protein
MKTRIYLIMHSKLGSLILNFLSPFISVKGLKRSKKPKKHPFLVAITIDTESGYVKKNQLRRWQYLSPHSFQGYIYGIKNWTDLSQKFSIPLTFLLSTQCFSADPETSKNIINQLKKTLKQGNEIGLHLHPDSDYSLQKNLKIKLSHTSAFFYDDKTKTNMIKIGKALIKRYIGINISSFRWGNWALDTGAVNALKKNKIKIDTSACPGIKGHSHDSMKYDWTKVKNHYPWYLSTSNYKQINNPSKVLEIPIATFNFLGKTMRADPINCDLLLHSFNYYYKYADRSTKPFIFTIISHSSEATHKDGSSTKIIETMEKFLYHCLKFKDVRFITLNQTKKYY